MQSPPAKDFITVKREAKDLPNSGFRNYLDSTLQGPIDVSSSSALSSSSSEGDSQVIQGEDDHCDGNASKQLVLYDPASNGAVAIEPFNPEPIRPQPLARPRFSSSRFLPSVGAFTVQCANCFKWRLILTKEKYEEIRGHILENPFVCEMAHEWQPDISRVRIQQIYLKLGAGSGQLTSPTLLSPL